MRIVRAAAAIALLGMLLVQSVTALAAPREARAGGRGPRLMPTEYTPQVPQHSTGGRPIRDIPDHVAPTYDHDPRHC